MGASKKVVSIMSKKTPRSEWLVITPEKAAEFLTKNTSNRPLRTAAVKNIAARMKDGRWIETHQGIAFDNKGQLIDGQHRLHAIVESGMPFRYQVTYDMAPEVYDHTDHGGAGTRSAGDLLSHRMPNMHNRVVTCAVAAAMMKGMAMNNKAPDKEIVVDFVMKHHKIITPFVSELNGSPLTKRAPIMAAFAAACRPITYDGFPGPKGGRSMDDVMLLAMRLKAQEWTGAADPMKTFFNRLLLDQSRKNQSGVETSTTKLYSLTVSAIRHGLAGKPMKKIGGTETDWGDDGDHISNDKVALRLKKQASKSVIRRA